ncbi:hypothetical protein CHARACLAT_031068, partial [Characodon lateralis]|nr:hypothetical protein [Characodon lateralis]
MKVCHTMICFFFLTSLQDGDTGELRTAKEGTNITVPCSFKYSGSRRFFWLKQSDSGRYRCRLDGTWAETLYVDFDLDVTEASRPSEPKWTLPTFTSKSITTTKATTTLTQRLSSSSSSSPSESTQQTRTSTGPK